MPYLNLDDYEQYVHLIQLFYAAHPRLRVDQEALRAQTGVAADTYFVAPADAPQLMRWARERHFVTRKTAERYLDVCRNMLRTIPEVVHPLLVRLGTPPRQQPGILSSEIYQWLYLQSGVPAGVEDHIMTVAVALELLEHVAADADELAPVRYRAAQLADWLRNQPPLL
jgi:hypothetical protein